MGELEERINSVLNDPEQLSEITRLARSLMGAGQQEPPAEGAGASRSAAPDMSAVFSQLGLDAGALSRLSGVLGTSVTDGRSQALLEAMKPYLSDKRKKKMDKAIKLARFAKLAGLAMGELGVKGDDQ